MCLWHYFALKFGALAIGRAIVDIQHVSFARLARNWKQLQLVLLSVNAPRACQASAPPNPVLRTCLFSLRSRNTTTDTERLTSQPQHTVMIILISFLTPAELTCAALLRHRHLARRNGQRTNSPRVLRLFAHASAPTLALRITSDQRPREHQHSLVELPKFQKQRTRLASLTQMRSDNHRDRNLPNASASEMNNSCKQ